VKWTHYYTFNRQRVAVRDGASGPVSWLHGDHLGSASVATNSSGGKIANSEQRFTPYGTPRLNASGLPTDKTFTGQRVEAGIGGIMDFNARYYDPTLGRFLSADTIVPGAGNPQAFNRYAYTFNNPLRYTDPTGHEPCPDNYCNETPVGVVQSSDFAMDTNGKALYKWLKSHPNYDPAKDEYLNEARGYEVHQIVMTWMELQPPGRLSLRKSILMVIASVFTAGGQLPSSDDKSGRHSVGAKLPKFSGRKTSGILVIGGKETSLVSGRDSTVAKTLSNATGNEQLAIYDHVEAKAAAAMRQQNAKSGDLWINNPSGPCSGPLGCGQQLPYMLPENAKLTVHYPDGNNGWKSKTYTGLPD
jgi:RHS repeat-associated protein